MANGSVKPLDVQSHSAVRDLLGRRFGDVIFTKIGTIQVTIKGTATQRHGIFAARINRNSTAHTIAMAFCAPATEIEKKKLTEIGWTQLHLRTYNNPQLLYDQFNLAWEKMGEPQHLNVDLLEEPRYVRTKDNRRVKNPMYNPISDLPLKQYGSENDGLKITYISEDKTVLVTCKAQDVDEENIGGQELPPTTTLLPVIEQFNTVIWFPATMADAFQTVVPIRGTGKNEDENIKFRHSK